MARTSYAKAIELAAAKRGKYEKQLEQAQRSGDRFAINAAQRSIARLQEYEQELFDSQEQQKIDKGITPPQQQMRYGGKPMYYTGGPLEGNPLTAADNQRIPAPMFNGLPYKSIPSLYTPIEMNPLTAPPLMPNFSTPNASAPMQPLTEKEISAMRMEDAMDAQAVPNQNTFGDMFKTYAPYAAQFGTDLYALNQLKKIEGPVDAPMMQTPQINTNVDTSATRARINDNAAAARASVDSSLSNSAAVQNVKLSSLAQQNRQIADIGQQEANQEMALRNQQSMLANQTLNQNLGTDAQNRQRSVDFENMIRNARMGIIQGMGVKAGQIGSEFAQRKLDKDTMDLISRQYDSGLLNRNFSDYAGTDLYNDPQARDQMLALLQDPDMGPQYAEQLKQTNPTAYNYFMGIINNLNQ
jgi:hypothetical protein